MVWIDQLRIKLYEFTTKIININHKTMNTKCLAYSCVSFGIFQAFKQIMCNSKSGRHYFWYFEDPEAFTLCHEVQHPGWIKVWYTFTVWLSEKAIGALPPATPPSAPSVGVLSYEWFLVQVCCKQKTFCSWLACSSLTTSVHLTSKISNWVWPESSFKWDRATGSQDFTGTNIRQSRRSFCLFYTFTYSR